MPLERYCSEGAKRMFLKIWIRDSQSTLNVTLVINFIFSIEYKRLLDRVYQLYRVIMPFGKLPKAIATSINERKHLALFH